MGDSNFGCCSRYQLCSDNNKCLNPELMNNCDYWLINLSKGINIYSKKNRYLYLIDNKRAFKISSTSEKNYSYPINKPNLNLLCQELIKDKITYAFDYNNYDCIVTGNKDKPAYFRVIFKINDNLFNIKNFNGFEITEDEAAGIKNVLPDAWQPEVLRWYSDGYVKINKPAIIKTAVEVPQVSEHKVRHSDKDNLTEKIKRFENMIQGNHQISIFEMMGR